MQAQLVRNAPQDGRKNTVRVLFAQQPEQTTAGLVSRSGILASGSPIDALLVRS
jgi:hypothetical protein